MYAAASSQIRNKVHADARQQGKCRSLVFRSSIYRAPNTLLLVETRVDEHQHGLAQPQIKGTVSDRIGFPLCHRICGHTEQHRKQRIACKYRGCHKKVAFSWLTRVQIRVWVVASGFFGPKILILTGTSGEVPRCCQKLWNKQDFPPKTIFFRHTTPPQNPKSVEIIENDRNLLCGVRLVIRAHLFIFEQACIFRRSRHRICVYPSC